LELWNYRSNSVINKHIRAQKTLSAAI